MCGSIDVCITRIRQESYRCHSLVLADSSVIYQSISAPLRDDPVQDRPEEFVAPFAVQTNQFQTPVRISHS
ncbi:hypothetical protein HBI31_163780 [Parastagonospora nodorum]|nr:hypothetical protein HBI31_163780 [Parastagonospora nodorum]